MFAQALAEYGIIAAMIAAFQSAWTTATDIITNPDSRLISIVGIAVLMWMGVRLLRR